MGQRIGKFFQRQGPLALLALFIIEPQARGACTSLAKGYVITDVQACKVIKPETDLAAQSAKYPWISQLDQQGKLELYNSYRGVLVKVLVAKSQAVSTGLSKEKGVLSGETIYALIPSDVNFSTCSQVLGKRITGMISESCCDGGGDAPCVLGAKYRLLEPKLLGAASSAAGDRVREKARKSKNYKAAVMAMKKKNYLVAVSEFEKAKKRDELDVRGHFLLGHTYHKLDRCQEAVPVLRYIQDKSKNKEIWADEEKTSRKGLFLLARCYARLNKINEAMYILNGYLLDTKKYRPELKGALSYSEFGWIHTTDEYREFKAEVEKRLK